jgi:flagellar motor switch protein FliN
MGNVMSSDQCLELLAAEFGNAVAALLGEQTDTTRVSASGAMDWVITVTCTGPVDGSLAIGLSYEDARRVSALVMGMDPAEVADEAVADTLREVTNQATCSLAAKDVTGGIAFAPGSVERATPPDGFDGANIFAFRVGQDFTAHVCMHATFSEVTSMATVPQPSEPVVAPVRAAVGKPGSTPGAPNLDVLLDIELPLTVRFGKTELPLLSLVRLAPGSVIDLHRSMDEPVDLMVSGKIIARGEVVVVEGNYGVRVTEIVSAADRIRTLGG